MATENEMEMSQLGTIPPPEMYHQLEYIIRAENEADPGIIQIKQEELSRGVPEKHVSNQIIDPNAIKVEDIVYENQLRLDPPEKQPAKSTLTQTYINMFKCFIGISILALPGGFRQTGWLPAVIGIVFVSVLNLYTMWQLVRIAQESMDQGLSCINYSDVCRIAGNKNMTIILDICIILANFGFCSGYLIFLGQQLDQIICEETEHDYCEKNSLYIFFMTLALIPFAWIQSLRKLAFTSFFALVAMIIALATIVAYDFAAIRESDEGKHVKMSDMSRFPLFFGLAVDAFEGNGLVITVKSAMKKPEKFTNVLIVVIIVYSGVACLFGLISYQGFGDGTYDIITLNLPHTDFTTIVQLLYSFGIFFTYPVIMFVGYQIIEEYECYKNIPKLFTWKYDLIKTNLIRTLLVILTALIAVSVPKFGIFLNFIGAGACNFIGFILPPWLYLRHYRVIGLPKKEKWLSYFSIIFGIIAGIIAVIMSFIEMINQF